MNNANTDGCFAKLFYETGNMLNLISNNIKEEWMGGRKGSGTTGVVSKRKGGGKGMEMGM
jgi:hypothetical protein